MSSWFPTQHVTVTWHKNNHTLLKSQPTVHLSGDTYNVTSSVLVPLQADDVFSHVLCHVQHKATVLSQQIIRLDQYLRGKEFLFVQLG